jgi:hypothetical protein
LNHTDFPATPGDVATLTVQEFTLDLDELNGSRVPSMTRVCRMFTDDVNRALVWWIRFGALKAWCDRADALARLTSDSSTVRVACEVAASFPLNHRWEFEVEHFSSAIEAATARRAGAGSAR